MKIGAPLSTPPPESRHRALVAVVLALSFLVVGLVALAIFLATRGCGCNASPGPGGLGIVTTPGGGAGSGTATVDGMVITLGGTASQSLSPGTSSPIDMTFDNPNSSAVAIDRITISVSSISAPSATTGLPCTVSDYYVVQTLAPFRLVIPANSSRSMSSLGLAPSAWPRIGMTNSDTDQTGCKLASVALVFTAGATP